MSRNATLADIQRAGSDATALLGVAALGGYVADGTAGAVALAALAFPVGATYVVARGGFWP